MSIIGKRFCRLHSAFRHFQHVADNLRLEKLCSTDLLSKRSYMWSGWLNSVFNQLDRDRIKMVGPDRACAEWLLKCGAGVKWKGIERWERHYNLLPGGNFERYKIEEIDATDSGVMHIGMPHLDGLKHLKKIVIHKCLYFDDPALVHLSLVKDTLTHLQISRCGGITDDGLMHLLKLDNLKTLVLFDLFGVEDIGGCYKLLHSALPHCDIDYADAGHGKGSKSVPDGG